MAGVGPNRRAFIGCRGRFNRNPKRLVGTAFDCEPPRSRADRVPNWLVDENCLIGVVIVGCSALDRRFVLVGPDLWARFGAEITAVDAMDPEPFRSATG